MYVRIGGIRLGFFGLLAIGWAVIPLYLLFKSVEGLVRLFVAAMNALDRHNRRRAVREAGRRYREVAHAEAGFRYLPQKPTAVRITRQPDPWRPGEKPGWR